MKTEDIESKVMSTHVALLRGVNVGGKNMLPMKDLTGILVDAGCADVRTYIQSGNAIFRAADSALEGLPGRITGQIAKRFGYQIPVILRTAEQLGETIRHNPFLKSGADEKMLHVFFLSDVPKTQAVGSLDPKRSPPDVFIVRGRDIYLHVPTGLGRSKLTNNYFDSKLATTSTARNWRTVLKLFELMTGV